ncbi:MAG: flavoprotein [Synergistaceae bacterium]|nr:flavoprotein [Synergistaceae bacterium]MBP9626857.1 flavoprotein [Synergistaceae bacterium]
MHSSSKLCWVITGAGHFLEETLSTMELVSPVDVFLTRAAVEVLRMYGVRERLERIAQSVTEETGYSALPSVRFAGGHYRALVIAPATANSVAKFSLGIADSLASSFFAQAGKSKVPAFILPTDLEPEMVTRTSSGRLIPVYPRPVDLWHLERLKDFTDVRLCLSPEELLENLRLLP